MSMFDKGGMFPGDAPTLPVGPGVEDEVVAVGDDALTDPEQTPVNETVPSAPIHETE